MVETETQPQGFCFILDDTVLIAKSNGVLEVFKVIVDSDEDSIEAIFQACYDLPQLAESVEYSYICISPSPTSGTAYKDTTLEVEEIMGSGQAPEWTPLCYPRMDERILCKASCNINLTYSHEIRTAFTVRLTDHKHLYSFNVIVKVNTFLKLSSSYPSQTPVPWEEWGPKNTRWFQKYDGQALHGQRAADTVPATYCRGGCDYDSGYHNVKKERRIRVRDFNPNAVRRSVQGQIEKGWKCWAVDTPSFLPPEGAFEDYLCSSLPYTEVVSEETFYTAVVLISGSQLVLPEVSEPSASFPMLTML